MRSLRLGHCQVASGSQEDFALQHNQGRSGQSSPTPLRGSGERGKQPLRRVVVAARHHFDLNFERVVTNIDTVDATRYDVCVLGNSGLGLQGSNLSGVTDAQVGTHLMDARFATIGNLDSCPHQYTDGIADEHARAQLLSHIRTLLSDLHDKDHAVRGEAAFGLGRLGAASEFTLPHFARDLRRLSAATRARAAYAVGSYLPDGADAIPALVAALRDPHGDVRTRAAYALGEFRDAAAVAIPDLIEALNDEDERVQIHAVSSLVRIGQEAVALLNEAKAADNPNQRRGAKEALLLLKLHAQSTPSSSGGT